MSTQELPQLLTTFEAAEVLGVSRMTIMRWINGEGGVVNPLPAKKVGRGYRIVDTELMNWFNSNTEYSAA